MLVLIDLYIVRLRTPEYVNSADSPTSGLRLGLFVLVAALHLSQQFSVMSGRSHRFLDITSTFWEVNVSCSRIQHGGLSEDLRLGLTLI